MIRAYPQRASVFPGDTLELHVSTDQPFFRADIYRQGVNLNYVASTGWMAGIDGGESGPDVDWGWAGYNIPIGVNWSSGAYIIMLIEGDSQQNEVSRPDTSTSDGRSAKALFIVKSPNPGKEACILYKISFFTFHAYKAISESDGSGSLYAPATPKVSFLRPGGGTGGNPWDSIFPDAYDGSSPRQTFAHWDVPFISWLEANSYKVDYCTDLDIHENENYFLSKYRLLLSVGHDEYWSEPMRNNIESFISAGGNVAFFSGNTCWWRVHLEDNNTAIRCDKTAVTGDQWFNFNPENKLTGVSYRNGSGWWDGGREAVGYQVQYAAHWVFNGTGLADGNIFGAENYLIGYECDGCLFNSTGGYQQPTSADSTPANFLILGIGRLSINWQDQNTGNLAATMGIYSRNGIVFTAATTDWTRVLGSGNDSIVERITRNVLKHLATRTIRILGPVTYHCGSNKPIEGQKIKLHADTNALENQNNLSYQWSVSGAVATQFNQPTFEITLPSPPVPVTVSVFIDDGRECPAFGTLTFTPLTGREAATVDFFCKLKMLLQHLSILVVGIGESKGPFVDPLYDPPKGELARSINVRLASATLRQASHLLKELETTLKELK
jgi:hypothetical protein